MEPIYSRYRINPMTLKPFVRSLLLIILLFLLVGTALPAVAQAPNGVTMAVQAGYDGYYKAGSLIPVIVTAANNGAPIEGELRITQGSNASGDKVVFNTPISLPTQSNKRVFMYVYPLGFGTDVEVELLDENGRLLQKIASNPIRQLPQDSLLYGVVTPEPGNLDVLEDVTGGRSEAAVGYLQLDELPDLPPAWNGLDVLVLHDVDTGQLNAGQLDALEKWLNTGGQLVVAGGAGWQKTAAALADMLPVAISGSETVDDLPTLQAAIGEPFRDAGPYLVTNSSLTNGELLLHEDGLPLLAQRPFGQGSVSFLALRSQSGTAAGLGGQRNRLGSHSRWRASSFALVGWLPEWVGGGVGDFEFASVGNAARVAVGGIFAHLHSHHWPCQLLDSQT